MSNICCPRRSKSFGHSRPPQPATTHTQPNRTAMFLSSWVFFSGTERSDYVCAEVRPAGTPECDLSAPNSSLPFVYFHPRISGSLWIVRGVLPLEKPTITEATARQSGEIPNSAFISGVSCA